MASQRRQHPARSAAGLHPILPTLAEAGGAGYDRTVWFAAFGPAKTPNPMVEQLHAMFIAALAGKSTQDRRLAVGIEIVTSTPDELRAFVISETKKWAESVRAADLPPE